MFKTRWLQTLLAGLILLTSAPVAHAEPAANAGEAPPVQAPVCAPVLATSTPAALDMAVQAGCTATCWDGNDQTCSGSNCEAQDSVYPSERGYCSSDEEGQKDCTPFPDSCPGMSCDYLHGQSCSKFGNSC